MKNLPISLEKIRFLFANVQLTENTIDYEKNNSMGNFISKIQLEHEKKDRQNKSII